MDGSYRYTMLIASLPHQPALFTEKQTALSRLRLEQRLGMLEEEDARVLRLAEDVVAWEHLDFEADEAAIVRRARAVLDDLSEGAIREIVLWRLELRTIMAALRRRARGEGAPGRHELWGHGRWVARIRRAWSEPDFGLSGVFPWIDEANRLLAADDAIGLERLVLAEVWQRLGRFAWEHEFDFEAVVIYVLRWSVIDRWSRYEVDPAARRLDELIAEALSDLPDLVQ